MHVLEVESGRVGYADVLRHVRENGMRSTPRGMSTLDAGPMTVVLRTPHDSLPVGTGRRLNVQIAAAEALQLIGAFSDVRLLPTAFDPFKEESGPYAGQFYGAYGVRVGRQLYHVVRKLSSDRDSRQAVVTLWDPRLDNELGHRDYPCTVLLAYRIHGDRLCSQVIMRSQDVWLGTPYDWFQFATLQLSLATVLGIGVGTYHHITLSTHLYDRDVERVDEVQPGKWYTHNTDAPAGVARSGDSWRDVELRARVLPYNDLIPDHLTVDEWWFSERLKHLGLMSDPGQVMYGHG